MTDSPRQIEPCLDWRERLEAFVDGELPPAEAEAVRAHVRHCAACLAELEALAGLNQGLRALGSERAPPALWSSIAARLDVKQPAEKLGAIGAAGSVPALPSRRAALVGAASLAVIAAAAGYRWLPSRSSVVTASVNDFITYRARGWTVDHAAADGRILAQWAQARVGFAVPELRERFGPFEIGGVRLCWLLNRRLLGVTYASGDDRAVLYIMEAQGLALPPADRTMASGARASVHRVTGHGVAVWTESDLVFVLVAAEKEFTRVLDVASQRSGGRASD